MAVNPYKRARGSGRDRYAAVITGDAEVMAALKDFHETVQKQAINKATKKIAAKVIAEYKARVPVRTGAMKRSVSTKQLKRKKARHLLGSYVYISQDKMTRILDNANIKYHKVLVGKGTENERDRSFYYPAIVEYGRKTYKPFDGLRPLREALYGQTSSARTEFIANLRAAITEVAARHNARARRNMAAGKRYTTAIRGQTL